MSCIILIMTKHPAFYPICLSFMTRLSVIFALDSITVIGPFPQAKKGTRRKQKNPSQNAIEARRDAQTAQNIKSHGKAWKKAV